MNKNLPWGLGGEGNSKMQKPKKNILKLEITLVGQGTARSPTKIR